MSTNVEPLPKTNDGRFEIRTTRDPNTDEIPPLAGYYVYDLTYSRTMFHPVSLARCRAWVSGYNEGLRDDNDRRFTERHDAERRAAEDRKWLRDDIAVKVATIKRLEERIHYLEATRERVEAGWCTCGAGEYQPPECHSPTCVGSTTTTWR